MKKTSENVTNTNNEFKLIGKKFKFCINKDTDCEKTEKASIAFIEWLKTPQNNKKYIDRYGIIAGGWCIDIADVVSMYHIGVAYDALTSGVVDVIYITFNNELLNRIVYLDNEIAQRGAILLPIDDKIEYIPFSFKYVNGTQKRVTKKQSTTEKTTATTEKTPTKKTKTDTTKKAVSENK